MKRARAAKVGTTLLAVLLFAHAFLACGSRTGLFVGEPPPDAAVLPPPDAPVDVAVDVTPDAVPDAGMDATPDVGIDALPMIDATPLPDVVVVGCLDAGSTEIYLVSQANELLSFYPPTATFTMIGTLSCPENGGGVPNSMGVDRTGTAYVNFSDGELFQVSTASAACIATPYAPGQGGFTEFGMGYVGDPADGGDTLFVAANFTSTGLAMIDTTSFVLSVVGQFGPSPITSPELTGTGDGRLFAFYADPNDSASSIVSQIDPQTAQEIASNPLTGLTQGGDYAFSFYGGDFYLFTNPNGDHSVVTRFSPMDGSLTKVADLPSGVLIVGAGVSTCAPR